jgi:hypothetical protein
MEENTQMNDWPVICVKNRLFKKTARTQYDYLMYWKRLKKKKNFSQKILRRGR